jgi:hypothetical protein
MGAIPCGLGYRRLDGRDRVVCLVTRSQYKTLNYDTHGYAVALGEAFECYVGTCPQLKGHLPLTFTFIGFWYIWTD